MTTCPAPATDPRTEALVRAYALILRRRRERLFRLIAATPWLYWQLLTKRPQNIDRMLPEWCWRDWPPNVWLGASVENMANVKRLKFLPALPGAVHFVSAEPLLGSINLEPWINAEGLSNAEGFGQQWVIIGGESGRGARPMSLDWARRTVHQCREMGVPVFVKQLGSVWARETGARDPKGGDPDEWPEDLRVREFPRRIPEMDGDGRI